MSENLSADRMSPTSPWQALRRLFDGRSQQQGAAVSSRKHSKRSVSPLRQFADKIEKDFWKVKLANRPREFWYPYGTFRSIEYIEKLCANVGLGLLESCRGPHGRVADIGAGDGDLAFLLEKMGLPVDMIDNERTNFNRLEGARLLKQALQSSVGIKSVDLDTQFHLDGQKYDAVFLLGILYHLKNPYFVMEALAHSARFCFLKTRVARQTIDGQLLSPYPVAYLVGPHECNNDDTNFWIFSLEGLKRLIERTGWRLLSEFTVGDTVSSTPSDPEHDERAFCLLQSRVLPTLVATPNPIPKKNNSGETTVFWSSGSEESAVVRVAVDHGPERLFAAGDNGAQKVNWIEPETHYEFRLYGPEENRVLASLAVTRE